MLGLLLRCFVKRLFNTPTLLGNWKQAEPSGCATKCGVAAGKSGTPGAVSCNTASCNPDTKPAAKKCPKTVDCGTFGTDMPIVNRYSQRLLLLHHHHPQPTQNSHQSTNACLHDCLNALPSSSRYRKDHNAGSLVKVFC